MSKYVIDDTTIKAVADPLRELNGSTATMTPAEMAAAGTDAAAEMQAQAALIAQIKEELQGRAIGEVETWTFVLEDGSEVTKKVVVA